MMPEWRSHDAREEDQRTQGSTVPSPWLPDLSQCGGGNLDHTRHTVRRIRARLSDPLDTMEPHPDA